MFLEMGHIQVMAEGLHPGGGGDGEGTPKNFDGGVLPGLKNVNHALRQY